MCTPLSWVATIQQPQESDISCPSGKGMLENIRKTPVSCKIPFKHSSFLTSIVKFCLEKIGFFFAQALSSAMAVFMTAPQGVPGMIFISNKQDMWCLRSHEAHSAGIWVWKDHHSVHRRLGWETKCLLHIHNTHSTVVFMLLFSYYSSTKGLIHLFITPPLPWCKSVYDNNHSYS